MNRFYKISIFLLLLYTCGIMYLTTGKQLDETTNNTQFIAYNIFQYGTENLFHLPAIKFNNEKDMLVLNSNVFIAPTVNTIASIIWATLIVLISNLFIKYKGNIKSTFWKKVFFINLSLSLFWFLIWCCMSQNFMFEGYYDDHMSILNRILSCVRFIFFIPSTLPDYIAQIWLVQGTDSSRGYENIYFTSHLASAFSVPVWSIIFVVLYQLLRNKIKRRQFIINETPTL